MSKSGKNGAAAGQARHQTGPPQASHQAGAAQGSPQAEAAHYDLIPSGELRQLYEKNRRLLMRLSETGRNNSILQTELCSMIEERMKLGAKNSILENQVASLLPLQGPPEGSSSGQGAGASAAAIEKAKRAQAHQERLSSLKRQSAFLAAKLAGFMRYRRRVRRAHASLKNEFSNLQAGLRRQSAEAQRNIQAQSGQIRQLQDEIKALKTAEAAREGEGKQLSLIRQKLQTKEKRGKELSGRLKKALAEKNKAAKELASLKAKASAAQKSYSLKLKRKESASSKEAFLLKQELKESLVSIERLKSDLRESEVHAKDLSFRLKEGQEREDRLQKEQKGLTEKLRLALLKAAKGEEGLKGAYERERSLRKTLSHLEESFAEVMYGYKRRRMLAERRFEEREKALKEGASRMKSQISSLTEGKEKAEGRLSRLKQESGQSIEGLRKDLQVSGEYAASLEKAARKMELGREKELKERERVLLKKAQKEIDSGAKERERIKGESLQAYASLKESHQRQIENLKSGFNEKLRLARLEMENDLLREIRKGEVLKTMKNKKIKELENSLNNLSEEAFALKAAKSKAERSYQAASGRSQKEVERAAELEGRCKSLKGLWEELQRDIERKDQQLFALRKLNRELSLLAYGKREPISLRSELLAKAALRGSASLGGSAPRRGSAPRKEGAGKEPAGAAGGLFAGAVSENSGKMSAQILDSQGGN